MRQISQNELDEYLSYISYPQHSAYFVVIYCKINISILLQLPIPLVVDANMMNSVHLSWGRLCVQTMCAVVLKVQNCRTIIHAVSFILKIMNITNETCKTAVIPEMQVGWYIIYLYVPIYQQGRL